MMCDLKELIAELQKLQDRAFEQEGVYEVIWQGCDDGSLEVVREWPNGYTFSLATIWPKGSYEE